MKAAGVIVEYNPFHNGHLYHIQQTKLKTNADIIIAVMSGNFLQRGEPALVSKWTRTKMAIEGGADIVVELPYAYATQKANTFAYGSISILDHFFVDEVVFGSENGNIDDFHLSIAFFEEHEATYNDYVKEAMKTGISYPRATSIAFNKIAKDANVIDLTKPNNILGFQYMKALRERKSTMKANTIKRTGANYHDQSVQIPIASATSIRRELQDQSLSEIEQVVPSTTYAHLEEYAKNFGTLHYWDNYFDYLKYKLLTLSPSELNKIYEVEEGVEYRLLEAIKDAHLFSTFMREIKSKRYTWTRLQRLCTHVLTNTSKEEMNKATDESISIRLLGMSLEGQQYINKIKKNMAVPLLSTVSLAKTKQLELDIKATFVFSSILAEPYRSNMIKDEFRTPPLRYDRERKQFL